MVLGIQASRARVVEEMVQARVHVVPPTQHTYVPAVDVEVALLPGVARSAAEQAAQVMVEHHRCRVHRRLIAKGEIDQDAVRALFLKPGQRIRVSCWIVRGPRAASVARKRLPDQLTACGVREFGGCSEASIAADLCFGIVRDIRLREERRGVRRNASAVVVRILICRVIEHVGATRHTATGSIRP